MHSSGKNTKQFYFPALVAGGFVVFGLYNLYFSNVSKHWPNTIGIVTNSGAVLSSKGNWKVYVRYEYQINGVQHSCDTYRFGGSSYFSRHSAENIAAQYSPGDQVKVFYDPNSPNRAVLATGMNPAGWLACIFFLSWLIAFVYFVKQIFTAPASTNTSFEDAKNTSFPD